MSATNEALARIFGEMAALLELRGESRFRVNAYAQAGRVMKELTGDVADLASDPARLKALDGIGDATARKIVEYVQTGRVTAHDTLLAEMPAGLLDVLAIPGLGPKTVRTLWEQAAVTDLASLERAIASGALDDLPRMGEKTISNIRESIAFAARSAGRVRLGKALPAAEGIVAALEAIPGTRQIQPAGSLRRGRETIGDLDIVASSDEPDRLADAFRSMPAVERVIAAGETKSSVRLGSGVQVDLRIVDDAAFGAALLYFTGSKQHNVALRERAGRRGLRLNEYGLFPDDDDEDERPPQQRGVTPVAARTEAEIFAALDLPWIPPELREDRGELDAPLPALVEAADIVSDLHAHTTASDGHMTIDELARESRRRGYHTVAVTDHSPASAQANGLSPDRLRRHVEAVREADARIEGITVLAGTEVDILADGRLDYDDEILAGLDIVIASPHVALTQDRAKATARLLAAIRHPLVHVLGHPTGRMINRRGGLSPDVDALVAAAAEHDTALEVNANSARLDLRDTHVRAAVAAGALVSINTDAHRPEQFDQMRYGVLTARRGWLEAERCLNAWPAERLHAWLRSKR